MSAYFKDLGPGASFDVARPWPEPSKRKQAVPFKKGDWLLESVRARLLEGDCVAFDTSGGYHSGIRDPREIVPGIMGDESLGQHERHARLKERLSSQQLANDIIQNYNPAAWPLRETPK